MKEQAIQKINKVGKVSYVIAVIAKIFVIIGLVVTLVAAVGCFVMPKDGIKMTMAGNMEIAVDYAAMGEKDYRIPYTQSLEAFTAARLRGIPARLVSFENEAHQVFKPQNSLVWNREFFGWLEKHLK